MLTNEPVIPVLDSAIPVAFRNLVPFSKEVFGEVSIIVLFFVGWIEDPVTTDDVPLIVLILEIVDD